MGFSSFFKSRCRGALERRPRTAIELLERRCLLSAAGVNFSYYPESGQTWSVLPNFSTLTPTKTGLTHNFDMSIRTADTKYGFVWTGNISITTAGTYTFYTGSDDGSKLLIGTTAVVNNDGVHAYTEVSGTIALTAGLHSITVQYFQSINAQQLTVSYAGPGLTKRLIPDSVLTGTDPGNVYVHSYGAVGNGTTNDSAAIQAAINAAPDGATLVLDSGRSYLLDTGLKVGRPLNVEGNGATLLLSTSAYPANETVFYNSSVASASYTWTQTVTAGQTTFNVPISTNLLIPGDTIFLQLGTDPNDSTQPNWGEVCQVTANTGAAVTVNIAVPYNISSGKLNNNIQRITDVVQNVSFKDVNFNYVSGFTPDTNLWLNLARNVTVSNITGQFTIMANVTDSQNVTITGCNGTLNKLTSSSGRLVSAWQTDGLYITNNTATTAADAPPVFLESWERNTTISGLTVNWNYSGVSSQDVFHFTGNSYNTFADGIVINNVGAVNLVESGSQPASYSLGSATITGPVKSAPIRVIANLTTGGQTYAAAALVTRTFTVQVLPNWSDHQVSLCSSVVKSMSFNLSSLAGVSGIFVTNSNNSGSQLIGSLVAGQTVTLGQIFGTDYPFDDPTTPVKKLHFYTGSTVAAGTTLGVSVSYYLISPTLSLGAAPATLVADGTNDVTSWVMPILTGVSGQPSPTGAATLLYYSGPSATGTPLASPPVSTGVYTVVASYAGDQVYLPVLSNPVTFTISAAPPPLVLSGSAFYLQLDADGQHVDVWNSTLNTGPPNQSLLLSNLSSIAINGIAGGTTVTVDFANGDPLVSSGLNFTGVSAATNSLDVIGTAGSDAVTVGGATVTESAAFGSATITYSNLSTIMFNGGSGSDVLTQTAQPANAATLAFNGTTAGDTLNINAGSFTFAAAASGTGLQSVVLGTLQVAANAEVFLAHSNSHADRIAMTLGNLVLAGSFNHWTGTLDLSDNDMIVGGADVGTLTNQVQSGLNLNGGAMWNGAGIVSSAAATNNTHLTTVGVELNNDGSGQRIFGNGQTLGLFDGQNPTLTDVLVKYTYVGDANLDGRVDGSDYTLIDHGYSSGLTGWNNGDFDYSGSIDGSDYTLIDNAFNVQDLPLSGTPSSQVASNTSAVTASAPHAASEIVNETSDRNHATIPSVGITTPSPEFHTQLLSDELKKRASRPSLYHGLPARVAVIHSGNVQRSTDYFLSR